MTRTGKNLSMRNYKHFIKVACLWIALFAVVGLFFIYHSITLVQSQTPATTPTSLRLAVKSFDTSIQGGDGTFKPVSEAPHVTSKSTGVNTSTTLNDTNQSFNGNQFVNFLVEITSGTGAGQVRLITGNTATILTVSPVWTTTPDQTSKYEIMPTFLGTATGAISTSLTDTNQSFAINQFVNFLVEITSGTGAGQVRLITSNTATILTVSPAWTTIPDNSSSYLIRPTVDVIQKNGSILNAGGFSFLSGTYLGIQITMPEIGVYSGPDPCSPGNTVNNVPIQLTGGAVSGGDVVFTYTAPGVLFPPGGHLSIQSPITIGSAAVELRLVFLASNSITCASDGVTAQLGTPPLLISSDDSQSPLYPVSLFAESLYTQYFYQGGIDKSQVTLPTNCVSQDCLTTGGTSTFNGYDFTWRLVRTSPSLPFSNTGVVGNASLTPPNPLTLIGNTNPSLSLNLGCNTLTLGQGPPLDLNINELPSLCTPPHLLTPVPAPNGLYAIPHTVNTQPTSTFETSTFNFTATPLSEPQFPQPIPTLTTLNDSTNKFPIQRINWIFSSNNPEPIIFSQQVQIFLNLPCDPTASSCNITAINPNYTPVGSGLNVGVRSQVFPDPNNPQAPQQISTTLTADISATDTTIPVASTAITSLTSFPTSGVIQIENEEISYTGTTATSFTGAVRGMSGTTAASHLSGTLVRSSPVQYFLDNIKNNSQAIFLSDVKNINYIIGDALGTTFSFDFQATGPDLVETNFQVLTTTSGVDQFVTTIPVASTTGFPTSGVIQIENEEISYTGVTATSFTGAVRGVNGTTAAPHTNGTSITGLQISTTLTTDITSIATTIPVASTSSFPASGVIHIDNEDISYTNVTATSFTGAVRGMNGTTPVPHPNGASVTTSSLETVHPGANFTVTDTVQNQGTANAGTSFTQYYLESTSLNLLFPIGSRPVSALIATELTAGISATDTTIPVASITGFPASGVIQIENEEISYSGVTSTSFTGALRGINGTTAASHLSGISVTPTPGATDTGTALVIIPSNIGLNTYSLLACADGTQLVLETNEQNNCITAAGTLRVQ